MARPLSEEKRQALLAAAVEEVAAAGIAAVTSKIAKKAGVAEGTLFVYFSTKDELFNQLFLTLKSDLASYVYAEVRRDDSIPEQIRIIWDRFIDWGVANVDKRKALSQLSVSDRVTAANRDIGEAMYDGLQQVMHNGFQEGLLRKQPLVFLGGVMNALADMVTEMISRDPAGVKLYKELGWEALWGAIVNR